MFVSRKTLTIAETIFQNESNLEFDVKSSKLVTVLDIINANKIGINQSCGGNGSCGTCKIKILEGAELVQPASEFEKEISAEFNLLRNERLACQTEIKFKSDCHKLKIEIVNKVVES